MGISREEFVKLDKCKVEAFLVKNSNKAFTVDEMFKILKIEKNTISGRLRNLKKKRKVLHKSPYWILKKR